MPADIYQAQNPDAGLTPLPSSSAPTEGFQALQQFASEGDTLAYRLQRARDMTLLTQAKTDLLQSHNALEQKYTQNPDFNDFKTAPGAYKQEATQTQSAIAGKYNPELSPIAQAELAHTATQLDISAGNAVNRTAFAKEGSTNIANWQTQSQLLGQNYLRAGSDTERAAIAQQGLQTITGLAHAGWITPQTAEQEAHQFASGLDEAYVAKLMQTDPGAAKAMLDDPGKLPNIDAKRRIALQNGAQAQVDETGALKLSILAKTSPPAAAAAIGRIAPGDTVQAGEVFDKGVIWQESRGNPTAISPAGAIGLSQVMPGTARSMARELGLGNVAGMSDADLTDFLVKNPDVNKQLGRRYWLKQVDHEGGYLPGAMAAYNAGPGNADRWMKIASDKFGNDPTPQQFMSVVDVKETRDYIGAIYQHLGAPTDSFGLTGNAQLRGQETVLNLGQEEARRNERMLREGASLARSDDPVTQVLQDGYAVDPVRLASYRNTQSAAAAAGDPEAAKELRRIDMAQAQAPIMRAAYQMTPEALSATVASREQQLQQSPNVTEKDLADLKTLKTVDAAMNAAKSTNTVGLAERQGMFRSTPILASDVGKPSFADALAARGPQTLQAADAYGGNIIPFKPDEAAALKTAWGQMGPADKAGLAATMAANLKDPRVYEAAVRQVAGDNRLDVTAGLIAGNNPEVARRVLVGSEMLKEKGVETKVPEVRNAIAQLLPENTYPTFDSKSDLVQAALANYAAKQGGSGVMIDATDRAGQLAAMEEVSGKLVAVNGRVTPLPHNASLAEFSTVMRNVTPADIKAFGGVQPGLSGPADVYTPMSPRGGRPATPQQPPPQDVRDANYLAQSAQLMPMSIGSPWYQVLDRRGLPVYNAQGAPLRVEYGQLRASVFARLKGEARSAALSDAEAQSENEIRLTTEGALH